ncbi:PQQ-binding-like beta-propeller repeat protein [Colwellia piezophila]|uniref:outer membrane protein assembly factor BamB family protein n=1 Tax=Colwellia piezophila TaxID=211668 RepID=UPI00037D710E|nr:PQQ-binding-like beta-propeller repeat protein [Colwellia piezophila]
MCIPRSLQIISIIFITLFITSCGGGSDGDETKVVNTPTAALSGSPVLAVNENTQYLFRITSQYFNSGSINFTIENLPSWATFDATTGELLGTPNFDHAGIYSAIKISASDGTSNAVLPTFSIEVLNMNRLPVIITAQAEYQVLEKELILIPVEISDADLDEMSVTLADHPAWLRFDSISSSLVGQPSLTDSGSYQIKIIVNDGSDDLQILQVSLIVKDSIEVSGQVIDGYISGAIVYLDENFNRHFDDGEISTTTNQVGSYTLLLPADKSLLLSKVPMRAYIGAGAQDLSRPELDFTTTPFTLSLPPIDTNLIENELVQGAVISPFSEQVSALIDEKIQLVQSGELSVNELQRFIDNAKVIITKKLITEGQITLEAGQTTNDISDIIFGDFIEGAGNLAGIIEQAEQYVDFIISAHASSDFDGDGLTNDIDTDDDGDGRNDNVDLFPFDPSEWQDTDGDNIGDNADFYPDNSNCYLVGDGDGENCYLNTLAESPSNFISASNDKIAYFYQEDGTLVTFDITTNHVINTQQIGNVSSMIFHQDHQRLYVGLDSGEIKYLNQEYVLTDFSSVEQCVNALIDAGSLLIALDCRGYQGNYVTFARSGEKLSESNNYYDSSKVNAWNSVKNRLYHFRDGISPNDLHYRTINGNGEFVDLVESPYHGDYRISGPIVISTDGSKVLLGSGDIYNADSLTWLTAVDANFTQAFWLDDGSLVTILQSSNQENITLKRRDSNLRLVEVRHLSGEFKAVKAFTDSALLILKHNGSLHFIDYLPSDDNDNDGVKNTLDAFPLDNSASLDTDQDGFPDNWHEGFTESSTNLVIDEYPLDSACWLSSHSNGHGCDVLATQPLFIPDKIVSDDAGNIYFLSSVNNRIYRWLSATNQFTNPIVMSSTIYHDFGDSLSMAYSAEHNRLYLGYSSGAITRFDLDELKENMFANIGADVRSLASVGNFLLAENANGAWNTHYILDKQGEIRDSKDWNRHSSTYAWNEIDSRVYSIEFGNLHYQRVDQILGHITEEGDIRGDFGISPPIKITADGEYAITGNGGVYNLLNEALTASLGLQSIDIISISNLIVSLENSNNSPKLKIWQLDDLTLMAELDVVGTPLALTPNGDELNLVTLLSDGTLNISAIGVVDADGDGLPLWWESLYNFDDNNSDDAALDSDNDGLINLEEFALKTNPIIADTDNDGLLDGAEVNSHFTSPLLNDSDQDGLLDGAEVNEHGTNPLLTDSDDDGLTDSEEINEHLSNPLSADSDNDGLSDLYEINNQLDINSNDANADADSDGLVNIDEMTELTNPNHADSDLDGLTDGDEVHIYLTQPLNRDSDADNMPDGWEITYGFDPLSNSDAELDFDNDSYANSLEFFLTTDPTDINDIPAPKLWNSYQGNADHSGFSAITIAPENLSVRWSVVIPSVNGLNPVVAANGKVFATSNGNNSEQFVFGINAVNGIVAWQQSYDNSHSINAPALHNGKVYFQTREDNNSYLRALNAGNGESIFAASYGNQWSRYKAPTIFDNDIYVAGGTYGGSYKFDGSTGQELWFQTLAQCDNWTPAVDSEHVFYFSDGFVIADKSTGLAVQKNEALNISCQTPILTGQNTALVISGYNLYAFDSRSAENIWSIETNDYYSRFIGTPSVALGKIYANRSGSLTVLDQFSGAELWSWRPQNNAQLQGNVVLTLNLAFVQDGVNTYAIDLNTHEQVWSYPVSGVVSLSVEGALYIAGTNGVLTAIDFGHDSDSDGIDDWWENLYGLDSQDGSDAALNADSDALSNLEEFQHATDPTNSDSDNDGLSDSDEVNVHLSNPLSSDSDKDGMPDAWEVSQSLNLLDGNDALLDADDDGISNLDEYSEQTDPHDGNSIPNIIETLLLSFEDAILPIDWLIDDALASSWGVSNLESSDGDYSIFSAGQSAISFSGYFNGNNLTFDVKSNCQSSSYISVYIDDELNQRIRFDESWQSVVAVIPRGRHTVAFKVDNCGVYLDNLQFTPLLNLFEQGVQNVTLANQKLYLYDFDQQLLSSINVPVMDYNARDLTVLADGRIAVFNGVFSPSLSIYNPIHATWHHKSYDGWGIVNNGTYGGIAHFNNYVYVTDMSISGSDTAGIVRFNLDNNSEQFFAGGEYIDITLGQDNMLYALSGYQVDKYDPDTMELMSSFTVSEARAIAVDTHSNIYTASWNGVIKQYDAGGIETQQLNITDFYDYAVSASFYDMNINDQNNLLLTNRNQQVLLVFGDLSNIELQDESFKGYFLAQVPIIDVDNDGMPLWWESKFGLNDNDATDAITDLDSDGLINIEEFQSLTLPNNIDTDEDGLNDFEEVYSYLTKPIVSDTDGDGLTDGAEALEYFTNPLVVDSDGDLFSDGDEINIYSTDPNDIDSQPTAINQANITFESVTLPNDWTHGSDTNAQWTIENIAQTGSENYALRSGDISDNQISSIVWQNVFSAGTLSFEVKVSSESCCDRFYLLVDGNVVENTVSADWQTLTTELSHGQHVIEFRYQKDGSVSRGDDTVWVDNIIFNSN